MRSGSSRSPSAVDPVMSANRIVATLRSSTAGDDAESSAPQLAQNRAPAATGALQRGHAAVSEPPHSGQKRAPSVTDAPQAGHDAIRLTTAASSEGWHASRAYPEVSAIASA